jgi:hypothetical protein
MNPVPKAQNLNDDLIKEFLKNGGKITKCESGARTEDIEYKGSYYAKRRKKKEDTEKGI